MSSSAAPMPMPTPIPTSPDFPIEWDSPEESMLLWQWDQSHFAFPFSPLASSLVQLLSDGFTKGFRASGMPIAEVRFKRVNTYLYQTYIPDFALVPGTEERIKAAVQERGLRMYQIWQEEYLPEVESYSNRLLAFDYAAATDAELGELLDWYTEAFSRVWEIHFSLLPGFYVAPAFKEACARLLGMTGVEPYELFQGAPNLSIESGSRLWQLAHRAPDSVKALITSLPSAEAMERLQDSEDGRAFLVALDSYLRVYGWRKGSFDFIGPSWCENPRLALDQVRLMLRVPTDPETDQRRAAERAEARANECRARLTDNPAGLGEFTFLLNAARDYPRLQEDHHFHLDQKFLAISRLPFLEIGRRLAARGLLDQPEDTAFLTFAEVRAALAGDKPHDGFPVEQRQSQMAHWSARVPAPVIGSLPPAEMDDPFLSDFFGAPIEPSADPKLVKGLAASRGTVTGTARVIRSLAEADRVQEGDILVCDMTTPAWTPLFASVSAIVADSGGPLSHCGVVAREYGLPCVVGTRVGSRTIPDGARITVDGAQGIVRIEG